MKIVTLEASPNLGNKVREALAASEVVVVANSRPPDNVQDLHKYYEEAARKVGRLAPMDENMATGEKTGSHWTDIRYDPAYPNSYRHSSTRQPLHTDGSYERHAPEISFFYCVQQARFGGATIFCGKDDLESMLAYHSPELYRKCLEIPLTFAKGGDSKKKTVISEDGRLTWNYFRVSNTGLEEVRFKNELHAFLEDKVVGGGMTVPVHLRPGDAVFFQDELLLHGRDAFLAHEAGDRYLVKGGLWLTEKL